MNIQEQLKEIGLFESEIKVYLYLLENGLSTPPQIAKGTKIARPNCYQVLRSLKERGLIGEQKKGSRKVYIASDPVTLVESMERKEKRCSVCYLIYERYIRYKKTNLRSGSLKGLKELNKCLKKCWKLLIGCMALLPLKDSSK